MKELTMKRDKQIQVTAKQGNKCGVEGGRRGNTVRRNSCWGSARHYFQVSQGIPGWLLEETLGTHI